jgi:Zn-dependent protease/CBS domain-containing protein
MHDSIPLGRIAGIRIGINWSWLIVFGLIAWSLASGVFPAENKGLSDTTYAVMGVVAALAFFASLLLHELGHALVARREGMEIDGITLWLFGGVARFRGMFPSAGAEFRIAIAGPLVTLALGLFFLLAGLAAGLPNALHGVIAWLGYMNLVLLAFNMLPALPLDGGRVLRSLLWRARGDFAWATTVAATIGRGFGFALIGLGLLLFIFQGAFSGAWLAFVGWFLLQAATAEARYLATRQALGHLRVGDLMIRDPATVRPDLTLGEFMDKVVWAKRYTSYPVTDNGHVLGLLPFRRVAEVPRAEWESHLVRERMLPATEVPRFSSDTEVIDALTELSESGLGRALVVEDDLLVGLLSITDIAHALEAGGWRRRPR